MGMTPPHLALQAGDDGVAIESRALLREHDLKGDVQKKVTKLVAQFDLVAAFNRVHDFVTLLKKITAE